MPAGDVAKIIGRVVLSVGLTALIYGANVVLLHMYDDSIFLPESKALFAAEKAPVQCIILGALVAQWHRRVSIRRRLLSFVIVTVVSTVFALIILMPQIPQSYKQQFGIILFGVTLIVSLTVLRTIETPWPIPIARLWRGEIGLASTSLIWLLFISCLLMILYQVLEALYDFGHASHFIIAFKDALALIFAIFATVSTWRSARNYKGPRRWRVLGKISGLSYVTLAAVSILGLLAEAPFFQLPLKDPEAFNRLIQSYVLSLIGRESQ